MGAGPTDHKLRLLGRRGPGPFVRYQTLALRRKHASRCPPSRPAIHPRAPRIPQTNARSGWCDVPSSSSHATTSATSVGSTTCTIFPSGPSEKIETTSAWPPSYAQEHQHGLLPMHRTVGRTLSWLINKRRPAAQRAVNFEPLMGQFWSRQPARLMEGEPRWPDRRDLHGEVTAASINHSTSQPHGLFSVSDYTGDGCGDRRLRKEDAWTVVVFSWALLEPLRPPL